MKNYFSRWFCWLMLSVGWLTFVGGCSSDQQAQQEEVQSEDEQQDVDNEEDENQNNENSEENNQNFENLENQNAENNINEGNAAQFEGNQLGLEQGAEGQQGDLQEIIEEMNEGGDQLAAQDQGMQAQGGDDQMMANGDMMQADQMNPGMDQGQDPMMADAGAQSMAPPAQNGGGVPEVGSKMSYIVQRGDTLGKIATKIYGDSSKWREIADFTGVSNPSLIYPGDVVYYQLTDTTAAFASAYENLPRSEVQVQEGDTLSTIARRVLGSSSNWKMIWRHNDNINNPDKLTAGTVLYYVEPGSLNAAIESYNKNLMAGETVESDSSVQADESREKLVDVEDSSFLNSVDSEFERDLFYYNA